MRYSVVLAVLVLAAVLAAAPRAEATTRIRHLRAATMRAAEVNTPVKITGAKIVSEKPTEAHVGASFAPVKTEEAGDNNADNKEEESEEGDGEGATEKKEEGEQGEDKEEDEAEIEKETEETEKDDKQEEEKEEEKGDNKEEKEDNKEEEKGDNKEEENGDNKEEKEEEEGEDKQEAAPGKEGGGAVKVVDEQHPATPLQDEEEGTEGREDGEACKGNGPCGGYAGLRVAKIVDRLTPGAVGFKTVKKPHHDKLWDELGTVDADDAEMGKLRSALRKLEADMINGKNWIGEVHNIIKHYEAKIGAVANGLKVQASKAEKLRGMIAARHKVLQRKQLAHKLKAVNTKLKKLEAATMTTEGKATNLVELKREMQAQIGHLEGEINNLHEAGHLHISKMSH